MMGDKIGVNGLPVRPGADKAAVGVGLTKEPLVFLLLGFDALEIGPHTVRQRQAAIAAFILGGVRVVHLST